MGSEASAAPPIEQGKFFRWRVTVAPRLRFAAAPENSRSECGSQTNDAGSRPGCQLQIIEVDSRKPALRENEKSSP
jgi:hypothetical protein